MRFGLPTLLSLTLALVYPAWGAPCPAPDLETRVTGLTECLIIKTALSQEAKEVGVLYLLLHGNHSNGSPAVSMFPVADKLAQRGPSGTIAVALIRPGYNDGEGQFSSGDARGRGDNFSADAIDQIADALTRLKTRYRPGRVVLIGHSGGAAIAGVMLGRHPGLAQAALLLACPCDVQAWRAGRGRNEPLWTSESPSAYAGRYPPDTRLVFMVAKDDATTPPSLSLSFASQLGQAGVAADVRLLEGGGHVSVLGSPLFIEAALGLAR
jgi:pimeloyl-ACP methyl ester carboxylesterase